MRFKQINESYETEIKSLLRKNGILFSDFRDYGYVGYDFINDISYINLKKHNGVYDYNIGMINGNAEPAYRQGLEQWKLYETTTYLPD